MTVFPVEDGVLLVPAVLPIRVTSADLKMTVADWLRLTTVEVVVTPDDEDPTPPAPYMGADVTEFGPDQSWLPQEPGSVVEDDNPDDEEEAEGGEEG
ncbi:hypothetical protein AB0B45_14790 [Nonomuraea sp. NPDC049152]|uniref:hypothetical protein n=1 Tax=Nonomuraea sp. NPDC049152 TaxID=3154350 RepID=UPI0033D890A5